MNALAPEADWVSRLADEVLAEARAPRPGQAGRLRLGPQPVRADPPGQPARGDDPAPGRRRDPAPRDRGRPPDQLGRLRPVPQGPGRHRPVVGRAHRQAADRRTGAARQPARQLGRPLPGPAARVPGRARHRLPRHQPDRAVHLRGLPRADPLRHARAGAHRRGPGPLPHPSRPAGRPGQGAHRRPRSWTSRRPPRPPRPPRAPARRARTTGPSAAATTRTSRTAPSAAPTSPPSRPTTTTPPR